MLVCNTFRYTRIEFNVVVKTNVHESFVALEFLCPNTSPRFREWKINGFSLIKNLKSARIFRIQILTAKLRIGN